jgi:hypothetical protein
MTKFLFSSVLALSFLPTVAQAQKPSASHATQNKATVSNTEATFVFPLSPKRQYEWFSGGLQYTRHINVANNGRRYEFGFYLFMPMGATPAGRGDLQQLITAGQCSIWSRSKALQILPIECSTNQAQDRVIVKLSGDQAVRRFFSGKPRYVTFTSWLLEVKHSTQVPVTYASSGQGSHSATQAPPPGPTQFNKPPQSVHIRRIPQMKRLLSCTSISNAKSE